MQEQIRKKATVFVNAAWTISFLALASITGALAFAGLMGGSGLAMLALAGVPWLVFIGWFYVARYLLANHFEILACLFAFVPLGLGLMIIWHFQVGPSVVLVGTIVGVLLVLGRKIFPPKPWK